MNALRIYAHGGRRPLAGPPRPARSPLLLATAHASPSLAPTAMAPGPPAAHVPATAPSRPVPPTPASPVAPRDSPDLSEGIPTSLPDEPTAPMPGPAPRGTSLTDDPLLAILAAPAQFGETVSAAYARKERELRDLLAALTPADALAMHQRLVEPRGDDAVATAFTRLVAERRARLLHFLADAPRRDAIASARR